MSNDSLAGLTLFNRGKVRDIYDLGDKLLLVASDRIDRVIAGQAQVRGMTVEAMREAFIARSPLKRMVTADDIVDATVFFASDLARSISGQVLAVNAGEPAG